MKKSNGLHSVEVCIDADVRDWKFRNWLFSQNGQSSTGVNISVRQFDIIKELVNTPEVVEYYEGLRHQKATQG